MFYPTINYTVSYFKQLIFFVLLILCIENLCAKEKILIDDKYKDVQIQSTDIEGGRKFHAELMKVFDKPINLVLGQILNFPSRCNNELSPKRKLTPKDYNCKFLNKNIVESVIYRKLENNSKTNEKDFYEKFILYINLFNVNNYEYYELVTVDKELRKGKTFFSVYYKMLEDKEVANYLKEYRKKKAAFSKVEGRYYIEQLSDSKTRVTFSYTSIANSWPLNANFTMKTILQGAAEGLLLIAQSILE